VSLLDHDREFPYCPGCGHPHVLRALDDALKQTPLPVERTALVTDIGCVGLADALFPGMHTVHTLHGRSVAVAAGLVMGDAHRDGPPLRPVVLIGDGGAGIGLLHLIHAAQINAGVTVLVHNNLLFGMTGGQHSLLTPRGLPTTTTPEGCPVPPLDLGRLLPDAGAGFFARGVAPGPELAPMIAQALRHPGFACVEILELCPTYATRVGGLSGKALRALPGKRGLSTGILTFDASRPPFPRPGPRPAERLELAGVRPNADWGKLDRRASFVLAGRAGGRVQSAALLAASAAMAAGLHAAVRTDNPVTQGKGFSVAEVTLGPEPIDYTGLSRPDLTLAVAPEGVAQLFARGLLEPAGAARRTVFDGSLQPPPDLDVAQRDYLGRFGGRRAALGALVEEIQRAGWWDRSAWHDAIGRLDPSRRPEAEAVMKLTT